MSIPGPGTRVVELRVHGILGTPAEELVDSVAAVDVDGDRDGRLVQPADRLRRPAPGPMLVVDGRPIPRTLEGYVWSAMTSGGWSKAIWAVLFPFTLANVSTWMLPPVPPGNQFARGVRVCCRALLRLAALLLTMLLVGQFAMVSLDLVAAQCLAPGSRCLGVPQWIRQLPAIRPAIGVAPTLIAVLVLNRVSRVNWTVRTGPAGQPAPQASRRRLPKLPGAGLIADPDVPALRTLHVVAALAMTAFLAYGGADGMPGTLADAICWTLALVLLCATAISALVFSDPTGVRPDRTSLAGRWVGIALTPVIRQLLIVLAVALVASVIVLRPHLPALTAGTDMAIELAAAALAGTCVLLGVTLIPAALIARRGWTSLPRQLRPWAGGWLAAPFMALAALLGVGFGAGLGITVRNLLGGTLVLPASYADITLLWGIAGALGALGAAVFGGFTLIAARTRRTVPVEMPPLYAGRPDDASAALPFWRRASWERRHAHQLLLGLTAVLSIGAAMAIVMRLHQAQPPAWAQPLSELGVVALGLFAVGLLRTVYLAARRPSTARHLGGLSDLASFWPREAHPMVPPCYALKVVPEMAARAAEHLADPNTRVVIAGHSQGSVLAAVAASRLLESLNPRQRQRLGLVIAGSPLQWAYQRAFPAVVPSDGLGELYADLGGRWRALCRGTDPIGGGITTWRRRASEGGLTGIGFQADGTVGELPNAAAGPTGALVLGGDHWLPDPQRGPFPTRRWAPGVNCHHDYYSDPEWDHAVARAAGLVSLTQAAGAPPLFPLPDDAASAS